MKRFVISLALTCVFSFSAMAGEMPTCGIMTDEPTTETEGNVPSTDLENPLVEMVLTLIGIAY